MNEKGSPSDVNETCLFIQLKNNGGLIRPAEWVISTVEVTEKVFRLLISTDKSCSDISRFGVKLEMSVLSEVNYKEFNQNQIKNHMINSNVGIDNHIFSLIRLIVRSYLDIRKFEVVRNWNLNVRGKNVRHILTKTVLFKNQ